MTDPTHLPSLLDRAPGCPFDPPEDFTALRAEQPIVRWTFPDGHHGWLVTSHELARAVLADNRFSRRAELMHSPLNAATAGQAPPPAEPGMFISMDPPEHGRYRHQLIGQFTVRRMRLLTERITEITSARLDAMAEHGPGVDLVQAYALPVPAEVIAELLGVSDMDFTGFQELVTRLLRAELPPEEVYALYGQVVAFMGELTKAKRDNLADDLLSDVIRAGDLSDQELTNIALLLLTAGFETTANMLALGTFALLRNPDQLAALRDGTVDVDKAIEELLRYLSIIPALVRTALADTEIGGRLVRKGEAIAIDVPVANRDPKHFTEPNVLDLAKAASGHVAFGYGVHQCLGQQLARVEMRVGFPALLRRFPNLRLAVEPEQVRMRSDMAIYGVHELPVAW
ncbi:MAG TPA: cytochrome P450 [Pseudonocardiaceae bacterium]|jgi:cytochrome P450|nr:cytochrome P450 [Pseudonocardiaceae bacterium]